MTEDRAGIAHYALGVVLNSPRKITPGALEKELSDKFSIRKKQAKAVIRDLILKETLTYTYHFGATCLEPSFEKPVSVTDKIILSPPLRRVDPKPGEVVIKIAGGASFGTGAHPTTRLCLRAMTHVFDHCKGLARGSGRCLDIGTGSGVLVITAMKLGMASGIGLDIDPNSMAEADHNVRLNGLADQIRIDNASLTSLKGPFSLIAANLRYPTLTAMAGEMARLSAENGVLVLSGYRPEEKADVQQVYENTGFTMVFEAEENEWAAMAVTKKAEE
jgi:ribosomal protein L11 methyltransferase